MIRYIWECVTAQRFIYEAGHEEGLKYAMYFNRFCNQHLIAESPQTMVVSLAQILESQFKEKPTELWKHPAFVRGFVGVMASWRHYQVSVGMGQVPLAEVKNQHVPAALLRVKVTIPQKTAEGLVPAYA